jgi:hypothetical protein
MGCGFDRLAISAWDIVCCETALQVTDGQTVITRRGSTHPGMPRAAQPLFECPGQASFWLRIQVECISVVSGKFD